jgi:ABC-type glycerol-3-phosphate transport system permease component
LVAKHSVLVLLCSWVLAPLVWVVLHSVKAGPFKYFERAWPKEFQDPLWANYRWLWQDATLENPFYRSLSHSAVITLLTVFSTAVAAVLAGYALSHLSTPGSRIILGILVASMFFPTQVTALTGLFKIQYRLGLIDRPWSLFFPYTAMMVAVSVFVMRGVFQAVPKEIVDAARIDGAGSLRTLVGILLPMVRNGIVVVLILSFNLAWGEYLLASTLVNRRDNWTLAVLLGQGVGVAPGSAALLVIAMVPALIAFGIAQHWFLRGLQDGALRG